MTRLRCALTALLAGMAGPLLAQSTRPERTGAMETSTYADVVAFLDTLRQRTGFQVGWMGTTTEGRRLPWVLAASRGIRTPEDARRKGRLVVWIQGNIHAGEVEGKEAALTTLRSLGTGDLKGLLDSLVVIVVPIYNADGNEAFAPGERNRPGQNGPASVGRRPTTLGLDLNRDYVKQEAPETRAANELINRWNPDLFLDLHTTNGSYHGYALTWAPGLNPNQLPPNVYIQDTFLPAIREQMRAAGFETFPYGNFRNQHPDSLVLGWETYDARPRFGVNWIALRGRMAILSEAYSNDPFARRIAATEQFVRHILLRAAAERTHLLALSRAGDAARPAEVAVRSTLAPPTVQPMIAEITEADGNGAGPFARRRRTGRFVTMDIPVQDRFVAQRSQRRPAGYYIPPSLPNVADLLERQGVRLVRVTARMEVKAEVFRIDSLRATPYAFEGHRIVTVEGAWQPAAPVEVRAGSWYVPTDQPLGTYAVYLLEPESEDGVVAWNFVDRVLGRGRGYPIVRSEK